VWVINFEDNFRICSAEWAMITLVCISYIVVFLLLALFLVLYIFVDTGVAYVYMCVF